MMDIQILEHSDVVFLNELQPQGWGDIVPSFEFYLKSPHCFPIKVNFESKVVGIGTSIIHSNSAWLAHIIVHPEYRNRGIGKLITNTLVNSIPNNLTIYLIATDLGAPVYKKEGFIEEADYLFFNDVNIGPKWATSNYIVPYTGEFQNQLIELDKSISAEDRFFQIEPHLLTAYIFLVGRTVEGFYLPSFGEGLILAKTKQAGIELMKMRLATKNNAVFPADNLDALNFMYQNDFKEIKKAKRMRLGKALKWQPECIYNRIGGNLG